MSWFQELAGKAENILTRIDQNAATVLQQPSLLSEENADVDDLGRLIEVTSDLDNSHRNASISIIKSPSVKVMSLSTKRDLIRCSPTASQEKELLDDRTDLENVSVKSDRLNSSRRSSLSSKKDGTVVECIAQSALKNIAQDSFSLEKELAATKIILAQIKSERDELKVELDSVQTQLSNSNFKAKLEELELQYQVLFEQKSDLQMRLLNAEETNEKYIKSISELESTVSKHLQTEHELSQKLEMARMETNNVTTELQQYRIRAHATLQLKEQMIEQLKNNETVNGINSNDKSNQIDQIELEQLKSERHGLLDEILNLNKKYENSKTFWQNMESQFKETIHELEKKNYDLQQNLSIQSTKTLQLEDDLNIRQKELISTRQEIARQRSAFSVQTHEKDTEILKLRNQVQKLPTSPSLDLEQRLSSLTQSLVHKQTTLETITAERNALRLQLEKLETQYRSTVSQIRQQRVSYMSTNETDDAKSQVPNFMVENPFDNKVARRVKRAYSSLDSVGIRLGVFLRRYPLIRILVIVYVAVLHLWVMFVLLSSTPS
ncbi:golgin-84 isoform X1 [Wyeomyia smithii]|uniref:golgin-84 isoform X1 n=1 Tax=Wyeomyia smithii TaxID=174621 RepID=UPI002467EEEA|nr:golgin-84 isoform X1 [Wyeomyia smithii]XP_055549398.1 golgin-84 isoform X1 [Wyeomyia smithii]